MKTSIRDTEDLVYRVEYEKDPDKIVIYDNNEKKDEDNFDDIAINIANVYTSIYAPVMESIYGVSIPLYGCFYWLDPKIEDEDTLNNYTLDRIRLYLDYIKDNLIKKHPEADSRDIMTMYKDIMKHLVNTEISVYYCEDAEEMMDVIISAIETGASCDEDYVMEDGDTLPEYYDSMVESEPDIYVMKPSNSIQVIVDDLEEKSLKLLDDNRYKSAQIINDLIIRYRCASVFHTAYKSYKYIRYIYIESFLESIKDPFIYSSDIFKSQEEINKLGINIVYALFSAGMSYVSSSYYLSDTYTNNLKEEDMNKIAINDVASMFILAYMFGILEVKYDEKENIIMRIVTTPTYNPEFNYQFYSIKTAQKMMGDGIKCDIDNMKGYPDAITNFLLSAPADIREELSNTYFTAQMGDMPVEQIRSAILRFAENMYTSEYNRILENKEVQGNIDIRYATCKNIQSKICYYIKDILDIENLGG